MASHDDDIRRSDNDLGRVRARGHGGYLFPEMVEPPRRTSGIDHNDYAERSLAEGRRSASGSYPDFSSTFGAGRYPGHSRAGFRGRAGDEPSFLPRRERAETQRRPNQFRGVGPRGYKRPDSRIFEDVNDRLTDAPDLDASGISVTVEKAEVTMDGFVADRRDKYRAEDCVESVSGVRHVQNNLRTKQTLQRVPKDVPD